MVAAKKRDILDPSPESKQLLEAAKADEEAKKTESARVAASAKNAAF